MSLQRVPLKDFRGGLNVRDSPFELSPNESPDLLNVTISALVGQLESRKGKKRIDTGGLPEGAVVDFAKQVVLGSAGARFLMLSVGGNVWAMNPAGVISKLFAGTAGTVWDFEVFSDAAFKDWVYMGNGTDAMQKWDGIAVATVAWPATKGVIPKGGVLCVWENRMMVTYVGANSQRLYFSEFGDPEATVAEYGFIDIRGSEEDLDSIQDLCVLGSRLMVLKRRGVFYITSAVTFTNRYIGGPGAWGRFQTTVLEDQMYFFNPQGIFKTGGVQVTMESGSITNYFPAELNKAQYEKARLIVTKDTYPRLLLSVTTGANASNDKLIEMVPHINFRRIGGRRYLLLPAFMLHTLPATALATWNPTGAEEIIVGAGALPANANFPGIAVSDTFIRANENPLNNAGKWINVIGLEVLANVATHNAANSVGTWATVIKKPITELELSKVPGGAGVGSSIQLFSCRKTIAAKEEYYEAVWRKTGEGTWEIKVYAWIKGEQKLIGEVPEVSTPALKVKDVLGLAVRGGNVYVGYKPWTTKSEPWETLAVVPNTETGEEGKSGFALNSNVGLKQWQVSNFAVAEWTTTGLTPSVLFRFFYGTTDEGEPIEAHWHSAWMAIQAEEPIERLRRLNVELSGDVIVDVFKDFEATPAFSATLPKAPEGEPTQYRFARVRPETRGRFHSVRFRSTAAATPFLINASELAIRGGKEH